MCALAKSAEVLLGSVHPMSADIHPISCSPRQAVHDAVVHVLHRVLPVTATILSLHRSTLMHPYLNGLIYGASRKNTIIVLAPVTTQRLLRMCFENK